MKNRVVLLLVSIFLIGMVTTASASIIEFVPPNGTGQVWTINSNDGYSGGRGMVYNMLQNVEIRSLGIYHDLININLSWEIAETLTTSGIVTTGQTILASGSETVTTNGLEWIDFSFSSLTLLQGHSYHFEFTYGGLGNQNFFYTQQNTPTYTQDGFELINGTQGGDTNNFVVGAFRVETGAPVPEPATMLLFGLGLLGLAGVSRKKN